MYVINSTSLIQAAQRQDMAISFWKVITRAASKVAGGSSVSAEILSADMESPDCYFAAFQKHVHPTSMPGPHLDAMSRTAVQLIAAAFDKLQAKCSGPPAVVLDLFGWSKNEMYLAATGAVYGPQSPLDDPSFQQAYERFESGVVALLMGVFPNLVSPESVQAREQLVKALGQYFRSGGHNDPGASELVRRRFQHNSDSHIPPDDTARFEVGHLVAILNNTRPATFWLLFHMYSDPAVLDDIRHEVWKGVVTTSREEHRKYTLDLDHIKTSCPILLSTFHEVLRFHNVGVSGRIVTRDHLLDGRYLLKKGSTVIIPGPVQHSDATIWGPTVGVFNHKRFLKQEKRPSPAAFRGFGGGSTLCPGRHFATTEITAFAALMAVRFNVRPKGGGVWMAPTTKRAPKVAAVPRPDGDIEVEVRLSEGVGGVSHEWEIVFSGSDKSVEGSAEDAM